MVSEPKDNYVFVISTTGLAETYRIEEMIGTFNLNLPKKV